jgi:hypothetical protein
MNYTDTKLVKNCILDNGEIGAVAKKFIPAGTIIGVHGGDAFAFPIVDNKIVHDTIEHREIVQIYREKDIMYGLVAQKNEVWSGIDYINHSCNPNVAAKDRIVIYSLVDILQDEPLVMDYRLWDFVPEGIECWCKNSNCLI